MAKVERYIMDVADVTFTRKSDGHVVFTSVAQLSSLSQTVDEETIRGGIGSRSVYTIKSNKEVTLTVRNATFDLEWLAMTQGMKIEQDTLVVQENATVTLAVDELNATATLPEGADATDGKVLVINRSGGSVEATATGGEIELGTEGFTDGEQVTVIYDKEVIGQKVEMRADRFAEKYKVQYKTVAYENENSTRDGYLYIVFENVEPSSAFDMSLENGTAFTPELSFTATSDNDGLIGTMFYEPINA